VGTTYKNLVRFIGSQFFFILTLVAFVLQAGWIAVSSRYPMAFDEAYHLGLIKIQSQQLSPIITHQPPGPAVYGALTRDPSYLYHWLMSFPYLWVTNHMHTFMSQVVTLRLINVAMFTVGLVLFKMVLAKTKASAAIINVALLFFILTPVVTLLAAHINYDNLLVPCIAGSLVLTLQFRERLLDKHQLSSCTLLGLLILCCLASLVKYPFLPIFAGIVAYIAYLLWTVSHKGRHSLHLWKGWKRDWGGVPNWQRAVLIISLVVSVGLFSYTYGANLILYQNPIPQCGQVLGPARCQAYGPWARNYHAAQHIVNGPNILYFMVNWIAGMFQRLFFVVNGSTGPAVYQNDLAPILAGVAAIGGAIGLFLFFRHGRRNLERDRVLAVLMFIALSYVVALWGRNYHDYVHLGEMVAINGRYLVPIILPFYVAAAAGWQQWLAGRTRLTLGLLVVSVVLCLQGGGIVSYIAYSNQYWYWPDNAWVLTTNKHLQDVVKPLVWAPKIR